MAIDLQRARARYAYRQVKTWRDAPGADDRTKIAAWLPGLPVLIRTQGFLVAMCMLQKDGASRLSKALADWILGNHDAAQGLPRFFGPQPRGNVVELCTEAPRAVYQAAQREALALAEMLKLMAAAQGLKAEAEP